MNKCFQRLRIFAYKLVQKNYTPDRIRILLPGLLAVVTVAIASRFLSNYYGSPTMLFALLLGMGFHFLYSETVCCPGIEFASKNILQLGVALLGLGVTLDQVFSIGLLPLAIVSLAILLTIISGPLLARLLNRGWRLGLLTGGAVAICGASAALAIASVLPKNEFSERNTLFTVISVTTLSTVAMIFYPMLVYYLEMDDFAAGVFIGATIHDVAQVIGAGYSISETSGDTATLVKMVRVASLVPIVIVFTVIFRKKNSSLTQSKISIPFFVIGFVSLILVGSLEGFPAAVKIYVLDVSNWCLVTAISAIGMKTALGSLKKVGAQAIILICAETVFLAIIVLFSLHVFM